MVIRKSIDVKSFNDYEIHNAKRDVTKIKDHLCPLLGTKHQDINQNLDLPHCHISLI